MSKAVEEKDLVWAKMRGYPHWPAKIIKPPKGMKPTAHKLFIFFYGTHEHAWLLESEVFPYEKFCDKFKKPSNRKGFMAGIRELDEELARIRRRGTGKKVTSPGKQKSSSPRKHPPPTAQHPTASTDTSSDTTTTTSSDTNKEQNTTVTAINQEDTKKEETDKSFCDLPAGTDIFFLSPEEEEEDTCSHEEAPILIRKRKALRSLSHEPVKRTRSHDHDNDDPADSLPLSESTMIHLSPPSDDGGGGGRIPSARATRSLTPHHYVAFQQQRSGVAPLEGASGTVTVQQSVPESVEKDVPSSVPPPPIQKEVGSKAGMDETEERGDGEQVQTSSDAGPEQKSSSEDGLDYFLLMGEEDKTSMDMMERDTKQSPTEDLHDIKSTKVDQIEAMDCTSQTKAEHSPKATSHSEEKEPVMMEQSATANTASPGKTKALKSESAKSATSSTTTCSKGSHAQQQKVTSPRRYSTRRQGVVAQGSTVEKLTKSYTARLEQALGSPDATQKKKTLALQSPKRSTPKGAKASPKAPAKSGGGKVGRRSRGGGGARGKAESEEGGGGGEGEKEKGEGGEGGDDEESVIRGADSQAVSEPSTPQIGTEKQGASANEREGAKSESKPEPGRRKSARLSSKIQQASTTPSGGGAQRKTASSSGKKQKEQPRSAGKKRSRQTSDSSLDEGSEELEASTKIETGDDTGQDAASKDGVEEETELQGETGDEVAPVIKKQSKRGRKSQTPATTASGEKATKSSKASKSQAPNSGGRVLRTRQKGVAGSKDKSQPKKIKLEEPSPEESLASVPQQQQSSHVETSEDKQPQEESEEAKPDDEASSESKRVLRKRKQTCSAKTSADSEAATNKESTSSSAESASKPTPTRQSKRLKVASKAESESMDEGVKPTTTIEEGSEELIIRVPTSVTKVNDSVVPDEKSTNEAAGDKTEEVPKFNDDESVAKKSTPSTSTDSIDTTSSGQKVSGGQSGDTGDQKETPPPTTCPPDESSSKEPNSSSTSSAAVADADLAGKGDGDGSKPEGEKDKVEPPKKIDRSDLPPMIKIRAGMSTVEVLQAYNYNIKASLVIDAPNVSKALTALHDLKELQFSAADLEKVPDLVYTVRKLKHYHASSKVVRRAEEVYGKLKGLYMYPKLVPRPLKKKAVGGAGIRKRPPTMAEYLNTQTKKQKPSQLSQSQTHTTKSKPSSSTATSSTPVTSNLTKSPPSSAPSSSTPPSSTPPSAPSSSTPPSSTPPSAPSSSTPPSAPPSAETEAGGITDVISKRPTSEEVKVAHAPVVPQLPDQVIEKISEDNEQPNQQLAEETKDTIPQSRDVSTASTDGSSTTTGSAPSNSSSSSSNTQPTIDTLQTSDNSNIVESEQSITPLDLQAGDPNSAKAANTEIKESSAPVVTEGDSFTPDLSCPDVNERAGENSNLLQQSDAKIQAATAVQSNIDSSAADTSNSGISESRNEERVNPPVQTSSHSLEAPADVSSSSISGSSNEGKSQEASKEDEGNDQIVPS